MLTRDRGPRLVENLPPTLLPNPVLMAAPRPDRAVSLLAALAVYCALGAAVLGASRRLATSAPVLPGTLREWTFLPDDEVKVVARPARAASGGPLPKGFAALPQVAAPDVMPSVVAPSLHLEDQSLLLPPGSDQGSGPVVQGAAPGPAVPVAPVRAGTVLDLDFRQIRVLHQVPPVYPALARVLKLQGPVELRLTIDGQGVPIAVEVVSGPHPLLIAEAVRIARLWRFQPATVDGAAVTACFRLTVGFRLSS